MSIEARLQPSDEHIIRAADVFLEQFRDGSGLILDYDGIVFQAESLHDYRLINEALIPALQQLESKGVLIGAATARNSNSVHWLRQNHSLRLEGPAILEEGHVLQQGGLEFILAHPQHTAFIAFVREMLSERLLPNFDSVKKAHNSTALCEGNFQWNGEYRRSWWFRSLCDTKSQDAKICEHMAPVLAAAALATGIDLERDIGLSISRMKTGLGIVSIKGKVNGVPINKSHWGKQLKKSQVFVADGTGDSELECVIHEKGGAVVGIASDIDISVEQPLFLASSDVVLDTPSDLVLALMRANYFL